MRSTIITPITSSGGLPAKAAEGLDELDQRYHPAAGLNRLFSKGFPSHWSFMLGEIALYRLIVLPLAGVDSHGHPADQGAPVPKKMNQSDSAGSPVPGSPFPPPGWGDLCP